MEAKHLKRYSKKSVPDLIKLATKHFNKFIRMRDSLDDYFKCISCGHPKSLDLMHAGHYLSAGNYGAVRFDERNVHGQCSKCNTHLHGNLQEYRAKLIHKIGLEEVEALEMKAKMPGHRWDRFGLIEIIIIYQNKTKNYEKDHSNSNNGNSRRMRWN